MNRIIGTLSISILLAWAASANATELRADVYKATQTGLGDLIGSLTVKGDSNGAVIETALKGLPPGPRGFHIHENASCAPKMVDNKPVPAGGAGSHFDPGGKKAHKGPHGAGHLGDLPALEVAADGAANVRLTVPKIKDLSVLNNNAVVIHAGGDNYSDQPKALGGGGGRFACGILVPQNTSVKQAAAEKK